MRYDSKSGISIEAKYSNEELNVTDGTLMNIFSLHEFSEQDGVVSLTVRDVNIVTYYTGEDMDYYVVLILNLLENPEDYEERLKKNFAHHSRKFRRRKIYRYASIFVYPNLKTTLI